MAFRATRAPLLIFLAVLPVVASAQPLERVPIPLVWEQLWLEEVTDLITPEERSVYETLTPDMRQLFRAGFWPARDGSPRSRLNEIKEHYLNNLSVARLTDSPPGDPRYRTLVLRGPPANATRVGNCGGEKETVTYNKGCVTAQAFELFDYVDWNGKSVTARRPVLFVQHDEECRLYRDDFDPPFRFQVLSPQLCGGRALGLVRGLETAQKQELDWEDLLASGLKAEPLNDWTPQLPAAQSQKPEPPPALGFSVVTSHLTEETETVVFDLAARLRVALSEAWWKTVLPWRNLHLRIDILEDDQPFSRFDHHLAQLSNPGDHLDIPLQLRLPEARYTLVAHIEDETAELFSTAAFILDLTDDQASTIEERVDETSDERYSRALLEQPWLQLPDLDGIQKGPTRIESQSWGGPIARVDLLLDGVLEISVTEPPFVFEIDLGATPLERDIDVRGYDSDGVEIARDRTRINRGFHQFTVELVNANPAHPREATIRGRVTIPRERSLDRIEIYENERYVATRTETPFLYSRAIQANERGGRDVTLFRAVAHLDSGDREEQSLLFSDYLTDEVVVDLVEVFASVSTRSGRPIVDLEPEEVTIFEDGVRQQLRAFQHLDQLPINVVLLLDTSGTMKGEIDRVRSSGLAFLEQVIRSDDRAALLSFSHRTYVVVPFTNDLDNLREGSRSLRAWGGTRVHDSTMLALHYLHGLEGKNALILVSDGVEESSSIHFEDVLEYAERSGTSVYTLGLGLPRRPVPGAAEARAKLEALAAKTGGTFFEVKSTKDLAKVYRRIEADLRSQYLISYESTAGAENRDHYRSIRIEIDRGGARVSGRPGYYP